MIHVSSGALQPVFYALIARLGGAKGDDLFAKSVGEEFSGNL
jgi:hypothetical protein